MSRDFWIVLATAIITSVLVFVALLSTGAPGLRQSQNMHDAEKLLPEVQAIIDADPRLAQIRIWVYTGLNGAVGLHGHVVNSDELLKLMRAVGELKLPVPIWWNIKVWSEVEAESSTEKISGSTLEPLAK